MAAATPLRLVAEVPFEQRLAPGGLCVDALFLRYPNAPNERARLPTRLVYAACQAAVVVSQLKSCAARFRLGCATRCTRSTPLFGALKQRPAAFLFCTQMQGVADVEGHDHLGGEAGRDGVHDHDEGRAAATAVAGQSINQSVL